MAIPKPQRFAIAEQMKQSGDSDTNVLGNINDANAFFTVSFDNGDRPIEHVAGSGIYLHRGTSSLGSFGCEVIGEGKVGRLIKK